MTYKLVLTIAQRDQLRKLVKKDNNQHFIIYWLCKTYADTQNTTHTHVYDIVTKCILVCIFK